MSHLLDAILLADFKTPDEEGRDIILAMLVVGCVLLGVVVLGELSKAISHRRRK